MTGKEYLQDIQAQLKAGHYQRRMGEKVLRAFGYVRRRATAIEEINATLEKLELVANPPIDSQMPLRTPRIIFSLKPTNGVATPAVLNVPDTQDSSGSDDPSQDTEDNEGNLPEPTFSISELKSANTIVECVSSSASIQEAYTRMLMRKYSQLVVANHEKPRQQDIKGVVSFQSIAKALMNGKPGIVGDCVDRDVSFAQIHDDLKSVVNQLKSADVVLVIGLDKRLQGIVTSWDLAEEFSELVDPFKRIEEIEERLRTLVRKRLGATKVAEFLREHGLSGNAQISEIKELTLGELHLVLDFPQHWGHLELAFDRSTFIAGLGQVRGYRNRLMHFKDPLDEEEKAQLTNFCDMVREIQL